MGKIIAFCGAGGTGKTSTLKAFVEKNPKYVVIESQARKVFEDFGLKTEADQDIMPPFARWTLQKRIQEAQLEYLERFKDVEFAISDRTQFDQIAYAMQYCSEVLTEEDNQWLEDLGARAKELYSQVFYLPLHTFEGQDDGMRRTDFGKRLQFDRLLQGNLYRFNVFPYHVVVDTIEDRADTVRRLIEIHEGLT